MESMMQELADVTRLVLLVGAAFVGLALVLTPVAIIGEWVFPTYSGSSLDTRTKVAVEGMLEIIAIIGSIVVVWLTLAGMLALIPVVGDRVPFPVWAGMWAGAFLVVRFVCFRIIYYAGHVLTGHLDDVPVRDA